ncbi:hypothetical protein ACWGE0_05815 [Lentzea sp. NPDC054927]
MRNQLTTVRRTAVAIALALLAVFALHPACPPEPAHHGAFTPGVSGEFCHHGDTHHLSAAAHTQTAVQASPASLTLPDVDVVSIARPAATVRSCPSRSGHSRSGRTVLIDIGISRT